jgi:methyl-accepting chemotaxis protein
MELFKRTYLALERRFFNSLSKKLGGNILFLLLLQAFGLVLVVRAEQQIRQVLVAAAAAPELAKPILAVIGQTLGGMLALYLLLALVSLGSFWFLRYLVVGPVRDLIRDFSHADGTGTDLSMQVSARTHDEFRTLAETFNGFLGRLRQAFLEVRQLGVVIAANQSVHERVGTIHQGSREVVAQMQQASAISLRLQTTTEAMQESVAHFQLGQGYLEQVVARTREFRDRCQQRLETLALQQVDVFDRNYRPVPGTDPPKYRTVYDAHCESALQALYDQLLETIDGGRFALCVDVNGYAPTHNSRYARPLTGERQTDLQQSRDKRIFSDGTGLRAARNQNAFLLQTYMRDTGEILSDLSLPLLVQGRHWGAVRLGFDPQVLLDQPG